MNAQVGKGFTRLIAVCLSVVGTATSLAPVGQKQCYRNSANSRCVQLTLRIPYLLRPTAFAFVISSIIVVFYGDPRCDQGSC